jgi:plastocyanin
MQRLLILAASLAIAALSLACTEDQGAATATLGPSTIPTAATPLNAPATAPTAATVVPTAIVTRPTSAPAQPPAATAPPAATQPPAPPTQPPAPAGPVTIAVTARNLAFDRSAISVPRNASVTVNFRNEDAQVAHDFGVSIPFVPHTETCNGPCERSISFDSGPPGTYTFQCSVHAEMVGSFTVS